MSAHKINLFMLQFESIYLCMKWNKKDGKEKNKERKEQTDREWKMGCNEGGESESTHEISNDTIFYSLDVEMVLTYKTLIWH